MLSRVDEKGGGEEWKGKERRGEETIKDMWREEVKG